MSISVSPRKKLSEIIASRSEPVNHDNFVSLVNMPYQRPSGSEDTKRPWQQVHEEHGNFWRPLKKRVRETSNSKT